MTSSVEEHAVPRLMLTPEEAADVLAIGRTKVYQLIQNSELESVKIGRSRRVPADSLVEFVSHLKADLSQGACSVTNAS